MIHDPLIHELIEALRCLPGVGPKSAQRIAYHLLERNRQGARELSRALSEAAQGVDHCKQCRTLSSEDLCKLCSNPAREQQLLCVVETPADVSAIEQATQYRGLYYVLMGHLSPLDGIGPEQLGVQQLLDTVREREVTEVILATNPTVEGDATAHYISELLQKMQIKVTRIAHGVPFGGELEYIDGGTLSHAFLGRQEVI